MGDSVNQSFERLWVTWRNSDRWRQFAKRGPGAKVFGSDAYRKIDLTRRYVSTRYRSLSEPALFQDVKTFCFLVGHAKSGGTLIGSLLDAHPEIIFADEADALRFVDSGFRREQIYHILLKTSRREAMKGRVTARRLEPYSFAVPGQWQGRYRSLQVVGDSKAGPTTRRLGQDPELLGRLTNLMDDVDVNLIHVIRNPYDPISTMMIRGKRTFENAIEHYFAYCATLATIHQRVDDAHLLPVRYEALIGSPKTHLSNLCHFLDVESSDSYLDACTGILHSQPEQSRHMVAWTPKWIDVVRRKIDQFDFLAGYSYEHY